MIKSRTPYYINIPFTSPLSSEVCEYYTLYVTIWTGDKTAIPLVPTYEIRQNNVENSNGIDKVNIAPIVKDYIDIAPIENDVVWASHYVIYKTIDPLDDAIKQLKNTTFATRGYGYGLEGENPQIESNILISQKEYKVSVDSCFIVPILRDITDVSDYSATDYSSTDYNT